MIWFRDVKETKADGLFLHPATSRRAAAVFQYLLGDRRHPENSRVCTEALAQVSHECCVNNKP